MARSVARTVKRRGRRREAAATAAPSAGDRRPVRIYREMDVKGARYWTLFDSGARGTYVTRPVARRLGTNNLVEPWRRALAGRTYEITESSALEGMVEGHGISAHAFVVGELFPDERGRQIEIIVGAEAMETIGIGLDMRHKRLDFTRYQKEAYEG